jgi:hypothetical protein
MTFGIKRLFHENTYKENENYTMKNPASICRFSLAKIRVAYKREYSIAGLKSQRTNKYEKNEA